MNSNTQPDYDVIAVGAGFAGLALIHYVREAGLLDPRVRQGVRHRRHLDLEPLSRRGQRQRVLLLLPDVLEGTAAGVEVVGPLPRLGREPALHALRRRQMRHVAAHSAEYADRQRGLPGGHGSLADQDGGWRHLYVPVFRQRDGHDLRARDPGFQGARQIQGTLPPLLPLAGGRSGLRRQARRHHRQWRHDGADAPGRWRRPRRT